MDKITCNVITDILPLYVDGIVSEDTRDLVMQHLSDCPECRKKYESMCANLSIPMDSNTKPLKRIKQAWNRKKVALICFTLVAALMIMVCGLFAIEEFVYQEQIAFNGSVFTQEKSVLPAMPEGCEEVGYLMGISFWTTTSPTIDCMGTNLDGKYGGCPLYQNPNDTDILYLEDFSGFFIPFQFTETINE